MITVIWSPKGGMGKTPLAKQLSYFLPKDTTFLDLDFNEGLSDVMQLNQPRPRQIKEQFIEEFLKQFYDVKQHLIIDCGGFPTDAILASLARADNIITPILNIKTTKKTPEKLAETLSDISKQINFNLVSKILWTNIAWNSSVENLNKQLPNSIHLKHLSFGIPQNAQFKNGEKIQNARVVKSMKLLMKELNND